MTRALPSAEMDLLRQYVTADGNFGANQAESTVLLHVTHSNLNVQFMELRLDKHMTIEGLKLKLCFHCGSNASAMILQLKNHSGALTAVLDDDSKKLGYYQPENGYGLHVIDTDPTSASANGWLEDTSKVDKYMMSDEDYSKREGTYRQFKNAKLAKDPNWTIEKEMAERRGVAPPPEPKAKVADPDHMKGLTEGIEVGARCQVSPGDKRGEVKYVGVIKGLPLGWWVGVQFDEPVGKSDGSAGGVRLFECAPGYASFVRPDAVAVGDYPEVDLLGSDDEF